MNAAEKQEEGTRGRDKKRWENSDEGSTSEGKIKG
jgi:hypothetical protein